MSSPFPVIDLTCSSDDESDDFINSMILPQISRDSSNFSQKLKDSSRNSGNFLQTPKDSSRNSSSFSQKSEDFPRNFAIVSQRSEDSYGNSDNFLQTPEGFPRNSSNSSSFSQKLKDSSRNSGSFSQKSEDSSRNLGNFLQTPEDFPNNFSQKSNDFPENSQSSSQPPKSKRKSKIRCKSCSNTDLYRIFDEDISYCCKCVNKFKKLKNISSKCQFNIRCSRNSLEVEGNGIGLCENHYHLLGKYTKKRQFYFPHDITFVEDRSSEAFMHYGKCMNFGRIKSKYEKCDCPRECEYAYKESHTGFLKGDKCKQPTVERIKFKNSEKSSPNSGYFLCHSHYLEIFAIEQAFSKLHSYFSWLSPLEGYKELNDVYGYKSVRPAGEVVAKKILEERYKVEFSEHRPDYLRAEKLGCGRSIDLYNHSLKLGVEVQGEQHYVDNSHFQSKGSDYLERDKWKLEMCKKNNVYLIQIPWDGRTGPFIKKLEENLVIFDKYMESVIK